MNLPIDYSKVDAFVQQNELFEQAKKRLIEVLRNLNDESPESFREYFYSDLKGVLKTYKFDNYTVSFSTSYSCKPELNYISIYIDIYDKQESYVAYYQVFFNKDLEIIDDKLNK